MQCYYFLLSVTLVNITTITRLGNREEIKKYSFKSAGRITFTEGSNHAIFNLINISMLAYQVRMRARQLEDFNRAGEIESAWQAFYG